MGPPTRDPFKEVVCLLWLAAAVIGLVLGEVLRRAIKGH
jgi:hypothetical protein